MIPDLAAVQHVLKVNRQCDHLNDPRVAVETAPPHVLPGLFVGGPLNRPDAPLWVGLAIAKRVSERE